MKVIPTLLTTTPEEFIQQMNIFQTYYKRIQLDITDGMLVPNLTVQIDAILELKKADKVTFLPSVEFDFHLMVHDFETELKKIQKLQKMGMKINTILVNAELRPNILDLSAKYNFSIGLDLFPKVQIADLVDYYNLKDISTIQVMTVNPGFQGSPFLPDMLTKIEQLRKQHYKGISMIDGGVNEKTIPLIKSKEFKPDYLCIGSYLTKAGGNLESRVKELENL